MNGFQDTYTNLRGALLHAPLVHVGKWHNQDVSSSDAHGFHELYDVRVERPMALTKASSQQDISPNLPWAEDHFLERVSGHPLNPPPSEAWWPFGNTNTHKDPTGEFSHTYPERFWPVFANAPAIGSKTSKKRPNGREVAVPHNGIRYEYGDLGDVVELLIRDPQTRQAVLPVWFPEDTGNRWNVRLPCSLHYQWQLRNGQLNCTYAMRSVDFWRHFRDDIYMAERLTQWIAWRLGNADPGILVVNIANLHLLTGDVQAAWNEALHEAL